MKSQPLKWHGGKFYLADKIITFIPKHIHYVEPFFGGGAVFFKKPNYLIENHSEVINDIHMQLMNFYNVLKDPVLFQPFLWTLEFVPFSESMWEHSILAEPSIEPVGRAAAFFIHYRMSRQGLGKDFATLSKNRTRRGMNEQVASYLSAVEGLPEAHERLQRVVILSQDALDVIRKEDSSNTFFYLDPPYLSSTRVSQNSYTHEMTFEQHTKMCELLRGLQGKFILSGYDNELYNSYGWKKKEIIQPSHAGSSKSKGSRIECLWMNYEVESLVGKHFHGRCH